MTANCYIEDNNKFQCYDIFGDPLDGAEVVPDWGYCQRKCDRFQFSQPLYSVCQGDSDSWSVSLDTLQCTGKVLLFLALTLIQSLFLIKEATSIATVVRDQIQVITTDGGQCILDTTGLPDEYKGHSLNAYNNALYLCGGQEYYGKECLKYDLANTDQGI